MHAIGQPWEHVTNSHHSPAHRRSLRIQLNCLLDGAGARDPRRARENVGVAASHGVVPAAVVHAAIEQRMEAVVLQPAPELGFKIDVDGFVALRNTQSEVSAVSPRDRSVDSDTHSDTPVADCVRHRVVGLPPRVLVDAGLILWRHERPYLQQGKGRQDRKP